MQSKDRFTPWQPNKNHLTCEDVIISLLRMTGRNAISATSMGRMAEKAIQQSDRAISRMIKK